MQLRDKREFVFLSPILFIMSEGFNRITRKDFLIRLSCLVSLPYIVIAGISIKKHYQLSNIQSIKISSDINEGVTFLEDIIIIKNNKNIRFLSSRCSHLGCRIHSLKQDELVCPCHGSRFTQEGISTKGPAKEPLKKLEFKVNESTKEYIINL